MEKTFESMFGDGPKPKPMNYSTAKRLARELLGPKARVIPWNGGIRIYVEAGDTRIVYGDGLDYLEALNACFELESEVLAGVQKKLVAEFNPAAEIQRLTEELGGYEAEAQISGNSSVSNSNPREIPGADSSGGT